MNLRPLSDLDGDLDRSVQSVLEHYRVPGAAVIVIKLGQAFAKLHGVKRIGSPEPVGPRTAFNVASTSKAFVSCAAAALVDDGLLNWDDPVQRHVPELEFYDPWITEHATLRDLSGNRTGLPRLGLTEYGFDPDVPVEEIFRRLKHTRPIAGFRDRFTYVNPGHTAVAIAVGRVAGKSFLQALRDRILVPLGMSGVSGGAAARHELADFAAWHCDVDARTEVIEPLYSDNYLGSGGLWICAEDAVQWLRLHLGNGIVDGVKVLSEPALRETHSPQVIVRPEDIAPWIGVPGTRFAGYGLGWAISEWDGERMIGHSGSDLGVAAQVGLAPERGVAVAIYLNKNCAAAIELKLMMLQRLLNFGERDWRAVVADRSLPSTHVTEPRVDADPQPGTRPAFELAAYAGRYFHPGSGFATVRVKEGSLGLELDAGRMYSADLMPLGGHGFLYVSRHPSHRASMRVRVEFVVDGTRPTRMVIPEIEEFARVS